MVGILDGLRVIDMGHFVAVPSAGAVLADWGAEVLKIEPPTGEKQRGIMALSDTAVNWRFEVHNRNKRSIALDLKKEEGRDILYKLVSRADIFMSNYQLSALTRLKMDYDTVSKVNSRLIYAYLTGYGTAGPDKDMRGFDIAAGWAHSGIQHLLGESGGVPPMQRGGVIDRTAGFQIVAGILAALYHREKTGKGQELSLSLYHCGIWTLAADLQVVLGGLPSGVHNRLITINPLSNTYQTGDGRWIQLAMLQSDLSWHDFCLAIQKPELENNPKFVDMKARAVNCEELIRILDEVFVTRTIEEWEKILRANNCIYSRVQTPEEVINDPQALVNNFFEEIDHPVAGKAKYVTTPVKFRQNPVSAITPAPETGQHTEEVLLELGYDWDDISKFKDNKIIP